MEPITIKLGPYTSRVVFTSHESAFVSDAAATVVVADENTVRFATGTDAARIVIPSGEFSKALPTVERIVDGALEAGLARDGEMIGLGGGVVCDTAAFAASVYMRGVPVVLVPTTLLAMVDAAVGGKTGVNHREYKNMIGTFYPAREVRIVPEFLASLPEREFRSGLAEVIKAAMLDDAELFATLRRRRDDVLAREPVVLEQIIARAIEVKARFVEQDFTETGRRAFLNLGHTFAHALESVTGFGTWSHGEAVAWGIVKAHETGVALGVTDRDYAADAREMIVSYGFETSAAVDPDRIIEAAAADKKKKDGRVRFILQRALCETFTSPVDTDVLRAVLSEQ